VTVIAAAIPRAGCDTTFRNIFLGLEDEEAAPALLANLNCFAFNYFARQKVIGTHLNAGTMEQLPVIARDRYLTGGSHRPTLPWISNRVVELTYTTLELKAFAKAHGHDGNPFIWNIARRSQLRYELDAAFFHLYLGTPSLWGQERTDLRTALATPRDAVQYILETFPIVKKKDVAKYGSYRTKERILAIYDEMAECIAKGAEWISPLDPPPGDPRAAWTEEEMEMWRQGKGDELIAKYGLLDDADEPDESDADSDPDSEDPADAEAEAVE